MLYDAQTVTGGTSVEALLAFMSAGTWEEFRAAMERYYDPGLHVVFADAEGNLAYQTLVHRPLTTAPARLAQEGWTGAQDITGRIPLDEMPHKLNPKSGFISHANNMPVGSWYPHDLGIATGGTGHTARSWRLEQLLSGDRRFSPDDFESVLHRDDVNSVVAALLPVARKVVEEDGVAEPEVLALVQAVAEWDLRAGSVARFPVAAGLQNTLTPYRGAGLNKRYGAGAGGVANLARRLAAEFAVTGEGPQDPAIRAYLLSWLRASARATSGETPVPDATITIPYQRCLPHNLPAVAPEKDIVSPPLSCLDTGTVWSQPGNVYTQIVDLADPDNSRAALAPGNSEDLGSPHRTSGMELWVKGRTRPAPLSRAAVEALGCTRTALTTQGHAGPDAAPPLTVAAADPAARYVPAIPAVEPPSEAAQPGLVRGRKPDDPRLEAAFRVILRQGTAQADVDAQLARCREFVAAEPALVGQLRDAATLGVYLIEESAAGRLAVQYGSPHVLGKLQELLAELGDGDEATGARPPDDPDLARPERGVFAHYMVCNPRAGGDAGVEDYMAEIRDAQAAGIDGFALNCGGWTRREPHYKQRTALIYEAARRLDTGFLLFISADYAGDLTLEETRDMVASFRDHPNQFRHDGKPVLSTFSGEGADNNAGRELIAFLGREFPDGEGARGVCFVPYYMPRPSITELPDKSHADQVFDTFPGLDGFFYFGAAGTGDALAASNALLADKWVGAGRVYMASVTPYYRGLGGNYRCFETRGFESMAAEFVA
ncbi:MAG: hypothetical protein FJX74_23290, partial [Armatimonadetes bacterium]|nr:hypothetical protein [Armatimonadota bacterium]